VGSTYQIQSASNAVIETFGLSNGYRLVAADYTFH
jgi:hypothetical protein